MWVEVQGAERVPGFRSQGEMREFLGTVLIVHPEAEPSYSHSNPYKHPTFPNGAVSLKCFHVCMDRAGVEGLATKGRVLMCCSIIARALQ